VIPSRLRGELNLGDYPCPYLPLGRARTGRAGHSASRDALRARCSASKVGIRERKIIGPEIRKFATASGVQVIIVARAYGIPPSAIQPPKGGAEGKKVRARGGTESEDDC
jgi:hypothetical protein